MKYIEDQYKIFDRVLRAQWLLESQDQAYAYEKIDY